MILYKMGFQFVLYKPYLAFRIFVFYWKQLAIGKFLEITEGGLKVFESA